MRAGRGSTLKSCGQSGSVAVNVVASLSTLSNVRWVISISGHQLINVPCVAGVELVLND